MLSPNLVTNLLDRHDGQRGRCHRHYCSTTQMSTSNILIDRTVNWLLVCYMILFMGAFSENSIVCLGLLKHSPVKHDEYSTIFLDKPTQGLADRVSVPRANATKAALSALVGSGGHACIRRHDRKVSFGLCRSVGIGDTVFRARERSLRLVLLIVTPVGACFYCC